MARYIIDGIATIVGSATLPLVSLYNTAAVQGHIREIHAYNTTSTGGFDVGVCRLSTTGTQGAGLTENSYDAASVTASCTGFAGHTVGPTLANIGPSKPMGAAIGDGVQWAFYNDLGLTAPLGTANGLGLYIPRGTGQLLRYVMVWDE